jgi:hypothetical protein
MKFKLGDVLVDKRGNRYKVLYTYKKHTIYPYKTMCIAGDLVGRIQYFGANGESWGTGNPGGMLDATLVIDYIINKMWEEYEV